jgi:hypothetical protein
MAYEGWGGWSYAVGSSMLLQNAAGDEVRPYCLMDRDYHTVEEIEARNDDARKRGIELHIWNRKEIENYFLIPKAIHRLISDEKGEAGSPSLQNVIDKIDETAHELKDAVLDSISGAFQIKNRGTMVAQANEHARSILNRAFMSFEGRISLLPGKEVLGKLANWSNTEYGVSFSLQRLSKYINRDEVPPELRSVITSLELGEPFDNSLGNITV